MARMLTRHITIVLLLVVMASLVGAGCRRAPAPTPTPVPAKELKYGVALALSGGSAAITVPMKRAFEMVAEQIGEFTVAGQRYKWRIIAEDNKYTSEGGVTAARKLLFEDNVKFIHETGSGAGLAAQPIIEGKGDVLFEAVVASHDILGPDKPRTIRTYQSSNEYTPGFYRWISQNRPDIKTMIQVNPDDATGKVNSQAIRKSAEFFGIKMLADEFYPRDLKDFYPLLQRVLPKNPDAIFLEGGSNAAAFLKGARELGYKGTFITITLYPAWVQIAGTDVMDGTLFSDPAMGSPYTPQPWNDLRTAYLAKFGEEPGGLIRYPYVALYVITEALKKAGTVDDIAKIMRVLETERFETPMGTIVLGGKELYGVDHQLILPSFVSQFKDGKEMGVGRVDPEEVARLVKQIFGK